MECDYSAGAGSLSADAPALGVAHARLPISLSFDGLAITPVVSGLEAFQ